MGVPVRRLVHIEMEQQRTGRRVRDGETELLGRLAQRSLVRCLARVDVATGLHPDAELLVAVEHGTAPPDDNARRRHVGRAGVLVAGRAEPAELGQEALLGQRPHAGTTARDPRRAAQVAALAIIRIPSTAHRSGPWWRAPR